MTPSTSKLVRIFCWVILSGAVMGLAAAHVPWIVGEPWSTCQTSGSHLGCELLYHLYGAPLVIMNLVVVWYGMKRLTSNTVFQFGALVLFMVVANASFFTFEVSLAIELVNRGAPQWESLTLAGISIILLTGCTFGVYLTHRLITDVRSNSS